VTLRRGLTALLALAPACFNPRYHHNACGPGDACPVGQICNRATGFCEVGDASIADTDGTGSPGTDGSIADAQLCFGTGLVKDCLPSAPTTAVSYSGDTVLDTGVIANCNQTMAQTGGPELCIVVGTTVTVGGTLTAIGSRALVLIATDSLTVSGTLDLSSTAADGRRRAGANQGSCSTPGAGADDTGGSGGGGGAGLGTKGGVGGIGDLNDNGPPVGQGKGGIAGAVQAMPTVLRGGCRGGDGGAGDMQHRSLGGDGGGAVYLIAGNAIHILGDVFASGAGGGATPGAVGAEQGGGGGGTGGMIGLDAPSLEILGRVVANGGAGGGGGGSIGGSPGGDGTTTNWNAPATAGAGGGTGGLLGGNGAPGTAIGATTNLDGSNNDGGAGGGAGGLGIIVVHGVIGGGSRMSPAPTLH
jgi:hypothetical protein